MYDNENPRWRGRVNTGSDFQPGGSGEATSRLVEHGTWAAIKRHRRAGEPSCDACRDYQRAYNRDYRIKAALEPGELARRRRRRLQREAIRNYVDPIAVERAVDLHQPLPTLNRAEKASAYTVMIRRGVPRCRVVARLRINWATAREFAGYDTTEATA